MACDGVADDIGWEVGSVPQRPIPGGLSTTNGGLFFLFNGAYLTRYGTSVLIACLYGRKKSGRPVAKPFDNLKAAAEVPSCQTQR